MIRIYYFSGTGNTRYIARKIYHELEQSGVSCAVKSIEEISPAAAAGEIAGCRAVLFGYPIYGSYTCELMVRFLRAVQVPPAVKVGFFCTQMMFSGDGARVGHHLLQTAAKTCWGMHFNMPNNLNSGRLSFLPVCNDPEKIRRRYLDRADKKVKRLAGLVGAEKENRAGYSFFSRCLGLMQRPGYIWVYKKKWHAAMQIEQRYCTRCALCYRQCPAGNVKKEADSIIMLARCVLCMRCYNFCPESAVLFLGRPHPPHKARYQGLPE